MLLSAYVCCSSSTLIIELVGNKQWKQQENWHLLRMNAPNHLRYPISSVTGGKRGLGSAITAKDRLQCLFKEVGGQGQHRRQSAVRETVQEYTPGNDCDRIPEASPWLLRSGKTRVGDRGEYISQTDRLGSVRRPPWHV